MGSLDEMKIHFKDSPYQLKRALKALQVVAGSENPTVNDIRNAILPLLKGNAHLTESFLQLIPDGVPSPASINVLDFEQINLDHQQQQQQQRASADDEFEYVDLTQSAAATVAAAATASTAAAATVITGGSQNAAQGTKETETKSSSRRPQVVASSATASAMTSSHKSSSATKTTKCKGKAWKK